MQAILKSKHQQFCSWLQSIRDKQSFPIDEIEQLENELLLFYESYQQKRDELREITRQYEEKQKRIRNQVKNFRRIELKTS